MALCASCQPAPLHPCGVRSAPCWGKDAGVQGEQLCCAPLRWRGCRGFTRLLELCEHREPPQRGPCAGCCGTQRKARPEPGCSARAQGRSPWADAAQRRKRHAAQRFFVPCRVFSVDVVVGGDECCSRARVGREGTKYGHAPRCPFLPAPTRFASCVSTFGLSAGLNPRRVRSQTAGLGSRGHNVSYQRLLVPLHRVSATVSRQLLIRVLRYVGDGPGASPATCFPRARTDSPQDGGADGRGLAVCSACTRKPPGAVPPSWLAWGVTGGQGETPCAPRQRPPTLALCAGRASRGLREG